LINGVEVLKEEFYLNDTSYWFIKEKQMWF
jgi:hypothetical protein